MGAEVPRAMGGRRRVGGHTLSGWTASVRACRRDPHTVAALSCAQLARHIRSQRAAISHRTSVHRRFLAGLRAPDDGLAREPPAVAAAHTAAARLRVRALPGFCARGCLAVGAGGAGAGPGIVLTDRCLVPALNASPGVGAHGREGAGCTPGSSAPRSKREQTPATGDALRVLPLSAGRYRRADGVERRRAMGGRAVARLRWTNRSTHFSSSARWFCPH